jgi:hypothetical protein
VRRTSVGKKARDGAADRAGTLEVREMPAVLDVTRRAPSSAPAMSDAAVSAGL